MKYKMMRLNKMNAYIPNVPYMGQQNCGHYSD